MCISKSLYLLPALLFVLTSESQASFFISFWCGPPANQTNDERYAEIAEANFTVVMPPIEGGGTLESNRAILEFCARHHLKAIIADSRIMAKPPEDPKFAENLEAVIKDYKNHPALLGYFLTDEPNSSAFGHLAAVNQYLLKHDPKHLPYINLFPTYASAEQLGNPTYEEHVEQFIQIVKPKLLSFDHYALFPTGLRPDYFKNLAIICEKSLKYQVPFCDIFLSTPHGPYKDPTEAELRWQAYNALAYGAQAIMYFTYWTPPDDPVWHYRNGIINYDGNRAVHYEMVKRINGEVKALGPTLLGLTSKAVYYASKNKLPEGTTALPSGEVIKSVEGSEVLIGMFEDAKKRTYVMVVNQDRSENKTEMVIKFDRRVRQIYEFDKRTGSPKRLNLPASKALPLQFSGGEGRLFRLVLNGLGWLKPAPRSFRYVEPPTLKRVSRKK